MKPTHLAPVPDEPAPFVSRDDFPDLARERWTNAKAAYAEAFRAVSGLHYLLHKPGQVRVTGTVTGALAEAKRLRDEADRLVVEFDAIVKAARNTR